MLWLWRRLAATALIRPLAWEPPYAAEAAQRKQKKDKKKKKKEVKGWSLNPVLLVSFPKEEATEKV